jgi:hypothetical protein
MTCDPDLVANPSTLQDPETNGVVLYWSCCGRTWFLSPTVRKERARSWQAWHFAAEALKPVNS